MNSFLNLSRRNFMTTAAITAAGSALIPKSLLAQDPVVNAIQKDGKATGREKVAWKARPFPMKQVRLNDGPCKKDEAFVIIKIAIWIVAAKVEFIVNKIDRKLNRSCFIIEALYARLTGISSKMYRKFRDVTERLARTLHPDAFR